MVRAANVFSCLMIDELVVVVLTCESVRSRVLVQSFCFLLFVFFLCFHVQSFMFFSNVCHQLHDLSSLRLDGSCFGKVEIDIESLKEGEEVN